MEIGTSGPMKLGLSQNTQPNGRGEEIDVDFALWGPFESLSQGCKAVMAGNKKPLQCSYSPEGHEIIGLGFQGGYESGETTPPAAVRGQIYILLLTNYSNTSGYITLNQIDGTGKTNCSIVPLPIEWYAFSAEYTHGKTHISWKSLGEKHLDHFEIEQSIDGVIWKKVADVPAHEAKEEYSDYHFSHVCKEKGTIYYKIVRVTNYWERTNSDILLVEIEEEKKIVKTVDLTGQELDPSANGFQIIQYEDGSTKRIFTY